MPRYIAFLRGVSPMNARMPELKRAFEVAGFGEVQTLLSSGNVVFNARSAGLQVLARRAEKAMLAVLGRSFDVYLRSSADMQRLIESEPHAEFGLPAEAKPVVTFLRAPLSTRLALPIERDGASILKILGTEVFGAYLPDANGPAFMALLERTFSKQITTRTLETVRKCAWA